MLVAMAFLIALLCGVICHALAKRRGVKPVFWGVMGFVFGPFAIPFVFLARDGSNTPDVEDR